VKVDLKREREREIKEEEARNDKTRQ